MWLKTLTTVTHLNTIVIGTVTVTCCILKISQPFPPRCRPTCTLTPQPTQLCCTKKLVWREEGGGETIWREGGGEYFWFSPSAPFPLCCRVQTAESHSHFYSTVDQEERRGTWGLFRHWAFFNKKLLDYKNKAILEKTFSNKINIICLN